QPARGFPTTSRIPPSFEERPAMLSWLILSACLVPAAEPPVIRSAGSGSWSAAATWEGKKTPAAGTRVLIRTGHTVTYDVHSTKVIRSVHISGTLTFATDRNTRLEVGLIKVQAGDGTKEDGFDCDAHVAEPEGKRPALLVGTPGKP